MQEIVNGAAVLPDTAQRALRLYRELEPRLLPEHNGEGVAIHPDSGDYLVAKTPTEAGRQMAARHSDGGTVTLRIGLTPEYGLAARVFAGEQMARASK